jgi:hypothetical protein
MAQDRNSQLNAVAQSGLDSDRKKYIFAAQKFRFFNETKP